MATRVTDTERVAADAEGGVERHPLVPPEQGSELALEAIRLAATRPSASPTSSTTSSSSSTRAEGRSAAPRGRREPASSRGLRRHPDGRPPGLSCVRATVGAATDLHAPMGAAETVVALDHVEPGKATGSRSFQVLFGPHNGSTRATLFVGYIPPGKAPWHYHLYDEIVWVLRGEGRVHVGDAVEELAPGSAFRLHAREVHVVENSHPQEELAVLGIFTPAGSPSAAYLTADVAASYVIAG